MSDENMREEFEAWAYEGGHCFPRSHGGMYADWPMQVAWAAWQASLSSASAAEPVATWNGYGMNEERQLLAELADLPLGTGLYTTPQRPAEIYHLPDSLYPGSKDWLAADYAGRVEWLHAMYEASKVASEAEPVGLIDCLDALIGADTQDGTLQLAQRTFLPQVRSALATQARPDAEDAARWRCVVRFVAGVRDGSFSLALEPAWGSAFRRGSLIEHFTKSVDARIAAMASDAGERT